MFALKLFIDFYNFSRIPEFQMKYGTASCLLPTAYSLLEDAKFYISTGFKFPLSRIQKFLQSSSGLLFDGLSSRYNDVKSLYPQNYGRPSLL